MSYPNITSEEQENEHFKRIEEKVLLAMMEPVTYLENLKASWAQGRALA